MPRSRKSAGPPPSSRFKAGRAGLLALLILAAVGVTIWKLSSTPPASAARVSSSPAVAAPAEPVSSAMAAAAEPMGGAPATSTGIAFAPTVPNKGMPVGKAQAGMVWIPGGEFSMGAQDPPDMEHDEVGMKATHGFPSGPPGLR